MEMVSVDGEELPAESPKLEENVSSSIQFDIRNPFSRSRAYTSQRFLGRHDDSSTDDYSNHSPVNTRMRQSTIIDQDEHTHRIDIEFINMSVVLRDGKKILDNVSGNLESGTMTAIMGPSGCGKSTTISALTNRIKNGGKVTGDILINQKKTHLMTIQHLIGFVPQDDIMHRDLTVRETLRFQAKLKANPKLTKLQRRGEAERGAQRRPYASTITNTFCSSLRSHCSIRERSLGRPRPYSRPAHSHRRRVRQGYIRRPEEESEHWNRAHVLPSCPFP